MKDEMKKLSGHEDGEELINADGTPSGEIAVADYDEDKKLIGWHKEPVKGNQ